MQGIKSKESKAWGSFYDTHLGGDVQDDRILELEMFSQIIKSVI